MNGMRIGVLFASIVLVGGCTAPVERGQSSSPGSNPDATPTPWMGPIDSAGSIATEYDRSTIVIDSARPVVARRFRWTIDLGRDALWDIGVDADVTDGSGHRPDDARLTIVYEQPQPEPGFDHPDLTESCDRRCEGSATIVIRLLQARATPVELDLEVGLVAHGASGSSPLDVAMTLDAVDEGRVDGVPGGPLVRTTKRLLVPMSGPDAAVPLVIAVPEELLVDGPVWPLVGRLETWVRTTNSRGHPNAYQAAAAFGEFDSLPVVGDEYGAVSDWLRRCTTGRDCEIPFVLQAVYDPSFLEVGDPSTDNFVELEWEVEVRLDALDGRDLPEDALVLRDG